MEQTLMGENYDCHEDRNASPDGSTQPLVTPPPSNASVVSDASMDDLYSTERMGCCGVRCWTVTGLLVALLGVICAFTFPLVYHAILNFELSLQPGTIMYNMWIEPPVPMFMRVYLFHVTNSDDVVLNRAKPILIEMGPYTFTERHERVNIETFDNATMQFQVKKTWHFVSDLSNGTLDDNITALNVPIVGAANALRYQPLLFKVGFNRLVSLFKSKLFVTKSVRQLVFDGYRDPLLDFAQHLPPGTFPPLEKFGWFYERNDSAIFDGVFNVFTGSDDITKMGSMDLWNTTRQTPFYESHCGKVNGSFGEAWPPRRDPTDITMFIPNICRSVTLDYTRTLDHMGITAYRFAGTERTFADADANPDNWCFCTGGSCVPSGAVNSSTCNFDSPVFISFPHFYLADPSYGDMVEGLQPDQQRHEFFIDMEPEMAVPTSVRARLQINVLVEPIMDIE